MELTRRDALAALAGSGIVGGAGAAALSRDGDEFSPVEDARRGDSGEDDAVLEALVATAEVVYPSAVENVEGFVRTYAGTKLDERPAFRDGATETLSDLDATSDFYLDGEFAALDPADREALLDQAGVRAADPDPNGNAAERIRFYYVNEVLFALYTSPTGGELVGIENPQGHPGGTDSYRRRPDG